VERPDIMRTYWTEIPIRCERPVGDKYGDSASEVQQNDTEALLAS
jgi:hypothetical protein